jgi:hypothetical protein
MLDRYLEGLVKEAKKQERASTLSALDMDDLAKLAGIRSAPSMCPKCGDAMTKVAGYLRCTCGVMKLAEEEPHKELAQRLGKVTGTEPTSDNLKLPKAGAPEGEKKAKCASRAVPKTKTASRQPAPSKPMSEKKASASLLDVGDAAGRILAKMAAAPQEIEGVPVEELQESIEEAKSREDVPGRAKRWGIGGGIGGSLAGGAAGYGLGHLLTRGKSGAFPWLARIGATAAGGAAGGAGGAYLGHRYGAEEAEADKLLESIRARNAFGTGAQHGYQQGTQEGYMGALEEMSQGGSPFPGR